VQPAYFSEVMQGPQNSIRKQEQLKGNPNCHPSREQQQHKVEPIDGNGFGKAHARKVGKE